MAQAVSRWPLKAEARVRDRLGPCGICGRQSDRFFSELFGFPLYVSFHLVSIFSIVCGMTNRTLVAAVQRFILAPPPRTTSVHCVPENFM
jgi:hypothetical protein